MIGTGSIVYGEVLTHPDLVDRVFIGEDVSDFFVNTGGVYLLPVPVAFSAKIVSFRAFGIPNNVFNESLDSDPLIPPAMETGAVNGFVAPYFYVLVFRPTGESYNLVHNLTQLGHGFAPGRVPADTGETLNWHVQKGDFIGAYIPYSCVKRSSDGLLQCPSQINLVANNCRSAFYHPALKSVNNLVASEFREVSVLLNLEATIVPLGN